MSASTPSTGANSPLRVAVGILTEGSKVFVTRRFPDSHQGGKWEFPGGKIEPGEDVVSALKRELREELGIEVQEARSWMTVLHHYPDRRVLLDVWRIIRYQGAPHGREGQEAQWLTCDELSSLDFPEADRPILRRLRLPALYLISDSRRYGKDEFLVMLERALRAGARLVQLREPHMSPEEYLGYARITADLCHRHGARLLINAEPEWVQRCDADGVHLNSKRLMRYSSRPLDKQFWVAASCHDAEELRRAEQLETDMAVLSPVAPTPSHPGAAILGWENFARLCAGSNLPVYALGGMRAQDLKQAREAGAQGLAMVSEIWGAHSIERAIAALGPD